jgi:hypothetical protein
MLFFILTILSFGQGHTKKVLFLGNSYTFVNNLPQMIADVAISTGDTLIYDSNTISGYTLDQHFADTNSTNKIRAGGWDYVVLQDQSQIPALPEYAPIGAIQLAILIKEFNPCARTLFYMTWGRKNGDALNCPSWPPVCTYEGMDSLLHLSYLDMAMTTHSEVSPVGSVWKYIRQNVPGIELYQSDESHPSLAGSYVAACCFYTSIFKSDPTFITYDSGLSSSDAANIRSGAKIVVYDSLSNWYFEDYLPAASFHYTIGNGNNEVDFINESSNAEMYLWNFGDGDTASNANPVHNYISDGTYIITLTASSCDLSQVYQAIFQTSINFCPFSPVVFPDSLVVCPNSSDTLWTHSYSSYQWFDGYDTIANETNQYFLPPDGGNYSVLATLNGCSEMSPPVIVFAYHPFQSFHVDVVGDLIYPDTACLGDTLKLALTPNHPPFPPDENIQWFNDGMLLSLSNNDTLIITSSGNYQVSYYDSTICPGNVIYTSPPVSITFVNCNLLVSENADQKRIAVYPNPSENFVVKINPELIGTTYTIIDMVGKEIGKGMFENEINNLKLTDVNSGIYILKTKQQNELPVKLIKK